MGFSAINKKKTPLLFLAVEDVDDHRKDPIEHGGPQPASAAAAVLRQRLHAGKGQVCPRAGDGQTEPKLETRPGFETGRVDEAECS